MKRFLICIAALLLFTVSAEAGQKKTLLIMLDGQRADAMYTAPTPNFDSLRNGTWAEGYKGAYTFQSHTNLESAPSSATNHVAIATGVTAAKNGVYKNGQTFKGKYDEYPTWMQRLRKADPNIVSVWLYNWGEDGYIPADATYQNSRGGGVDGDVKIIDETIQILNGTFPDTPGVKDTKWTKGTDVDAIMLYLDSLDMFGHRHGFSVNVDEYYNAVKFYDEKIGKILDAIKSRPNFANEDWMIVVTADHGGIYRTHGVVGCKNCYTIPLIVSAKDIEAGKMAGQPQNCCSAAYVLKHMTGSIPEGLDGYIPQTAPETPANLDNPITSVAELKAGCPANDFSFVIWFKANGNQEGDPAIVSNKDWNSGRNPGIALATFDQKGDPAFTLNIGDGKNRDDFRPMFYKNNEWTFIAVTAQKGGNAMLFVGTQNGRLAFISDDISEIKSFSSNLNWNIGNDGTGNYKCKLNGETKGFQYWPSVLTIDQINELYKKGLEEK